MNMKSFNGNYYKVIQSMLEAYNEPLKQLKKQLDNTKESK